MRRNWLFAIALAAGLGAGCAKKPEPIVGIPVNLPAGTSVELILMRNLESGKTEQGSQVPLMVAEDVKDSEGHVVIPKGELATGNVKWSRGQDALDSVSNRPPRLTITVDETKTFSGSKVGLSADPEGRQGEPLSLTRDNTGRSIDSAKLDAMLKDPETGKALEALAASFAKGDSSSIGDTPEAKEALRKVATGLGLPETQKLANTQQLDKVQQLLSQLQKGSAVTALVSGGGSAVIAAAAELAGVAGEVGSRLGGIVKGRTIRAYLGTRITAKTTGAISERFYQLPL